MIRQGWSAAIALVIVTIATAGCGGSAPSSPAAATAAIDCSLVTPADFTKVGIDGAGEPTDNPSDGSHYCVYAGTSGATGGIEFDVFPNPDEATAKDTYATASGEGPQGKAPDGLAADEATLAIDGDVVYLTARKGTLVISFAVPSDINTDIAVVQLAKLVFERAGA